MAASKVPTTVTAEGTIDSGVVDGYLLFSVEKIWVNAQLRRGTDDRNSGFNLVPPAGKEIVVRFREDITKTTTGTPENTLSEYDFFSFLQRLNTKNSTNLSNLESF